MMRTYVCPGYDIHVWSSPNGSGSAFWFVTANDANPLHQENHLDWGNASTAEEALHSATNVVDSLLYIDDHKITIPTLSEDHVRLLKLARSKQLALHTHMRTGEESWQQGDGQYLLDLGLIQFAFGDRSYPLRLAWFELTSAGANALRLIEEVASSAS